MLHWLDGWLCGKQRLRSQSIHSPRTVSVESIPSNGWCERVVVSQSRPIEFQSKFIEWRYRLFMDIAAGLTVRFVRETNVVERVHVVQGPSAWAYREEVESATQSTTNEILQRRSWNAEFILRQKSDAIALGYFYFIRETCVPTVYCSSEWLASFQHRQWSCFYLS